MRLFFVPKYACFEQLPYPFQSLQTLTITFKPRFTDTHLILGQLIITENLLCSWRKKALTFSPLQPATRGHSLNTYGHFLWPPQCLD